VNKSKTRLFCIVSTILFFSFVCAATIESTYVFSEAMQKDIPLIIIIPDSYQSINKSFPVVYLLHGYSGSYRNWIDRTNVKKLSDQFDLIIVCPDGDKNSWYIDSPVDTMSRYDTHIGIEVVEFIDANFRTVKSRQGRAIAGLSMGGHGAFMIAVHHQDTFSSIGSMSGGLDLRPFADGWEIKQKIGPIAEYPERWDSLSAVNNISQIENGQFKIIFDCGVDDFFIEVNRELHRKLLEAKIPHEYIERPGTHSWDYWKNAVKYQIFFFYEYFNQIRSEN
jgi:S-formylglutathione hydrolase FrmB